MAMMHRYFLFLVFPLWCFTAFFIHLDLLLSLKDEEFPGYTHSRPHTHVDQGRNRTHIQAKPLDFNSTLCKLTSTTISSEAKLSLHEISDIKKRIKRLNDDEEVLNEDIYGPLMPNTTILLVQVHRRLDNLCYLVDSMARVRGIRETLVVFSHDFYDPTINAFIRGIEAFRTMQIFFPFSLQLHLNTFPGTQESDCPWNTTKRINVSSCSGEPDAYGQYRNPEIAQIKHHWWWKVNKVFKSRRITRGLTSWVVFLEEDHYLLPDFLNVLWQIIRGKDQLCPHCQIIALGNYMKSRGDITSGLVTTWTWTVTSYNLGFAMNDEAWRHIQSCTYFFCAFDDYNWDWTLHHLNQECLPPKKQLNMVEVLMSRVLHIGSCGMHAKKKSCDVETEVQAAERFIQDNGNWLFPKTLKHIHQQRQNRKLPKPYGGWGDHRDHQLCRTLANM